MDAFLDVKVILPIIAFCAGFIGLILAKEQKTSEFRQTWIDELRKDISKLLSVMLVFHTNWLIFDNETKKDLLVKDKNRPKVDKKTKEEFLKENIKTIKDIPVLIYRIKLRLNIKKDESFIETLDKIEEMFSNMDILKEKENLYEELTKKLYCYTHKVLKDEWVRVKRGEPSFYMTKIIFIIIISFFTVFGALIYMVNEHGLYFDIYSLAENTSFCLIQLTQRINQALCN